jgi:hypothetical protein
MISASNYSSSITPLLNQHKEENKENDDFSHWHSPEKPSLSNYFTCKNARNLIGLPELNIGFTNYCFSLLISVPMVYRQYPSGIQREGCEFQSLTLLECREYFNPVTTLVFTTVFSVCAKILRNLQSEKNPLSQQNLIQMDSQNERVLLSKGRNHDLAIYMTKTFMFSFYFSFTGTILFSYPNSTAINPSMFIQLGKCFAFSIALSCIGRMLYPAVASCAKKEKPLSELSPTQNPTAQTPRFANTRWKEILPTAAGAAFSFGAFLSMRSETAVFNSPSHGLFECTAYSYNLSQALACALFVSLGTTLIFCSLKCITENDNPIRTNRIQESAV